MNNIRIAFLGLAALSLAGCGQTDTRQADIQALKDSEARWNQEYAAKDLDKVMAHYTDTSIVMAPGMASSSGPAAIRKTIGEMVKDPAFALQFHASMVEVSKSGDVGF